MGLAVVEIARFSEGRRRRGSGASGGAHMAMAAQCMSLAGPVVEPRDIGEPDQRLDPGRAADCDRELLDGIVSQRL